MVKAESLGSDVDFIKEFEELKIKQRLLIESLKRKSQSEDGKLFLEINAKLDFLVKIFKEANSNDDKKDDINFEEKFNEVFDKFDSLSAKVDESLKTVEELQSKVINDKKILDAKEVVNKIEDVPVSNLPVDISAKSKIPLSNLPPPPPSNNIDVKSDIIKSGDEKDKKRKWF